MAFPDIRNRAGYLFLVVAVGHIILISAQVNTRSGVPILESVVLGAFSGVQRATSAVLGGVRYVWQGYVALHGVHQENEALRRQMADLQVRLQQERARAEQAGRLQQLLDMRQRASVSTTAAEVVAGSASPEFRTVTIGKGSSAGIRSDMAVLSGAGVVGRVVATSRGAAKVQLLVDGNAAAGALIARSRTQGIVTGTGGDLLHLDYVPSTGDVKAGDFVLTSGSEGIYPKGFVIGRVESVDRQRGGLTILVRPAVNFSAIEEVLVVLGPPSPAAGPPQAAMAGGPQ
jgi:rod shape-determining protein MreC